MHRTNLPQKNPILFNTARFFTGVYRFNTLRISSLLLQNISERCLINRRLFGRNLEVDISRGNPQRLLYLLGERFIEERHIVKKLVKPGMTAVDVGANIGYYALMLSSFVGRNGRVSCIEPDPDNLVELGRNVELNNLLNVSIVPAAAGSSAGVVGLARGINAHVAEQPESEILVRMVTIDDLQLRGVGFMKVDVEGYELQVLLGAESLIREQRPNLFIEVHPPLHKSSSETAEVIRLLSSYYRDVVIWTRHAGSVLTKISTRYCGRSPFKCTRLSEMVAEPGEIFWIGCIGS